MKNDKIFGDSLLPDHDFAFNGVVTEVFDDMLHRSIPLYQEMQQVMVSLINKYVVEHSTIYDLGCSLGNTSFLIASKVNKSVNIIGLDSSFEMINEAKSRINKNSNGSASITFIQEDLNENTKFSNTSVVILCLTLQFIRPLRRNAILRNIYNQLNDGGILILVEKNILDMSSFNRTFIELYHDFKKKNGYSNLEINKKRISLENVLIPYSIEENKKILFEAGFREVTTFFQWLNFSGLIAQKC